MIQPVERASISREMSSADPLKGDFVSKSYPDTIRFGKKESSKFFDTVKDLFHMVWSWIKYNIFFCFFDVEEEKENTLKEELKTFIEDFTDKAEIPTRKKQKEIVKDYKELDPEITQLVEECILEILKEADSELSETELKNHLKTILANPFYAKLQDESKTQEQREIMLNALLQANLKLSGHSKE